MARDAQASSQNGESEKVRPPVPEGGDSGGAGHVQESLRRLSRSRLRAEGSIDELKQRARSLRDEMTGIIREDKGIRIERGRLTSTRDGLRAKVIELRRERLEKQTGLSAARVALREERQMIQEGGLSEVERLAHRVQDLREEVDAFEETLRMHRRDRDRTFNALLRAYGELQDLLTEELLWKIVTLQGEEEGRKGERVGKAGLAAEMLGRLLVLEKEESQLAGLLARRERGGSSGAGAEETG